MHSPYLPIQIWEPTAASIGDDSVSVPEPGTLGLLGLGLAGLVLSRRRENRV